MSSRIWKNIRILPDFENTLTFPTLSVEKCRCWLSAGGDGESKDADAGRTECSTGSRCSRNFSIYKISQTGVTILIVEQNVRMALLLAEYGYIIRDGDHARRKIDNLIHSSVTFERRTAGNFRTPDQNIIDFNSLCSSFSGHHRVATECRFWGSAIVFRPNIVHGQRWNLRRHLWAGTGQMSIPYPAALIGAMILAGLMGMLIEGCSPTVNPFRRRLHGAGMGMIICGFGMSVALMNVAFLIWGADAEPLSTLECRFKLQIFTFLRVICSSRGFLRDGLLYFPQIHQNRTGSQSRSAK